MKKGRRNLNKKGGKKKGEVDVDSLNIEDIKLTEIEQGRLEQTASVVALGVGEDKSPSDILELIMSFLGWKDTAMYAVTCTSNCSMVRWQLKQIRGFLGKDPRAI